jgi:glycosyltransferase involved in cell wall biosynthesis
MLTEQPLISVITVCYNSRATIERALQSVVDQQWSQVEHIVIDGDSTDGTVEILERFRPHLAALVSEADKGIYDAMNKGLARASGEIVCFLNADDQYADPEVLSDVVQHMQLHRLDALVADVGFFRADDPTRMIRHYRSDRFSPKKLAWGWMPAHPGFFLRREVAQRVGMFKTDYRIAGDYEFVVRAFHGHQLRYRHLPRVLVHMQAGGASNKSWRARVLLNQEVLRACRENGVNTNMAMILSKYPAKLLEMLRP